MLSNPPPSGLHARQRQHRRQNSTPAAFDAMKITKNLPASQLQRQQQRAAMSHRRGMSLDTRRQEFTTVSDHTNTGINTSQHVLRETQQQRIARPGTQQHAYANLATDENYLISPHSTPRGQRFLDGLGGPQNVQSPFDMYSSSPMSNDMAKNHENAYHPSMAAAQDFDLFPSSTLSTPTFMTFQDSPTGAPEWISDSEASNTRRASRRISNGILDRVAKFENLHGDSPSRPLTPPQQNATDYFPLTPMDTPHDRTIKHAQRPQRFSEEYDESMEETVKPTRKPANRRPKTTFDEMRQAAEARPLMPSPPRASTMPMPGAFDPTDVQNSDFLNMDPAAHGMAALQTDFDTLSRPSHPLSATSDLSHHASPATPLMGEFSNSFENKPDLTPGNLEAAMLSGEESYSTEMPSRRGSPHRRTESVASIVSAASIATLDIEQTKTMTGITMDDIHQFIQGPDPKDNKWVCTFEDCNKKFGRKENIKSHVQTHLNDRQYQCPTCNKCFVRQHDLKRHAKIHTGIKPYPCECGNSFARHDALTRHKQRGMCIGAFDGVVRKVVKRGRPRKHRPDMDERKEKSARTRKKNNSTSSASSQSGYSDSSAVNSPENMQPDFDMLDDLMDVSMGGTTMNPSGLHGSSSAPMPNLSAEPPSSAHSPSAASVHSYVSQLSHMSLHQEAIFDALPASSQPASPAKSVASQFNEPPELSQSSSPPSCGRFFDLEPNSSGVDSLICTEPDSNTIPSLAGLNGTDEDVLLQFTHSDPSLLMLSSDSKFDEAFDTSADMFTNNDDLFFGSS
jgi:regulatory protein SWI5